MGSPGSSDQFSAEVALVIVDIEADAGELLMGWPVIAEFWGRVVVGSDAAADVDEARFESYVTVPEQGRQQD